MQIWKYRPLFLACTVFSAAALIGFFCERWVKLLLLCVLGVGLLVAVSLAIATGVKRRTLLRFITLRRSVCTAILLAVAILSTCVSLSYFDGQYAAMQRKDGRISTVDALIVERRGSGSNMTTYTVSVEAIDGESTRCDALLTCYYESDLQAGEFVRIKDAELRSLRHTAGDYYEEYHLIADGFSIGTVTYDEDAVTFLDAEDASFEARLRCRMGQLRRSLSESMKVIFGKEANGIPSAVLLGERDGIPGDVRQDFARAGVAHMLAISGLHMTLLFGMLDALLGLFVRRRTRAVILGTAAFSYVMLLGFPPSATRAVIMLGMIYLSYLCAANADTLTSLGLAATLILLATPYAVADVGFWLSVTSTFGLVVTLSAFDRIEDTKKSDRGRMARILAAVGRKCKDTAGMLAAGVVSITFSLLVTALGIGEFSILSPICTVILSPALSLILIASPIAMLLKGTAIGPLLANGVTAVVSWMCDVTAAMSEPEWVVCSLKLPAVLPIAAVMTGLLLVALAIRLPRQWMVSLPAVAGWIAIALVVGGTSASVDESMQASYVRPSSASEMLVLAAGNEGVICDMSNGSGRSVTMAVRAAQDAGVTELSAMVLTHYHSRTVGSLTELFDDETVRTLYLPYPTNENEYYLMRACLDAAEHADVPAALYRDGEFVKVLDGVTLCIERSRLARSTHPVLLAEIDTGAEQLTFCGGSVFESALAQAAQDAVAESQYVILGSHGPVPREAFDPAFAEDVKWIAFADREVVGYMPRSSLPDTPVAMSAGEFSVILRRCPE